MKFKAFTTMVLINLETIKYSKMVIFLDNEVQCNYYHGAYKS